MEELPAACKRPVAVGGGGVADAAGGAAAASSLPAAAAEELCAAAGAAEQAPDPGKSQGRFQVSGLLRGFQNIH